MARLEYLEANLTALVGFRMPFFSRLSCRVLFGSPHSSEEFPIPQFEVQYPPDPACIIEGQPRFTQELSDTAGTVVLRGPQVRLRKELLETPS